MSLCQCALSNMLQVMLQNVEFLTDSTDFYTPNELKVEEQDYPSLWFTLLYEEQRVQVKS